MTSKKWYVSFYVCPETGRRIRAVYPEKYSIKAPHWFEWADTSEPLTPEDAEVKAKYSQKPPVPA